mgnify:CR=1 FL=1
MSTHTLTIHLFANLKERVGRGTINLEVPFNCTVADLKTLLKAAYPGIAHQLNKVVITANGGHVFIPEEVLPINADVSILPPFGGG